MEGKRHVLTAYAAAVQVTEYRPMQGEEYIGVSTALRVYAVATRAGEKRREKGFLNTESVLRKLLAGAPGRACIFLPLVSTQMRAVPRPA